MIIQIKAVANAKKEKVLKEGNAYKVYTTAQREKGKANKKIIELLSKELNISKNKINILKGETTSKKIIEIKKDEAL